MFEIDIAQAQQRFIDVCGQFNDTSRLTFLPVDCGDDRVVHLGGGYTFFDPARNLLQYASQDEIFIGQNPALGPLGASVLPIDFGPPFVNTGAFNVDHVPSRAFPADG